MDASTKVQELRRELSRKHGKVLSREDVIRCEAIRSLSVVSPGEEIDALYFSGDTNKSNWEKVLAEVFQRLNLPPDVSAADRLKILGTAFALMKDETALESIELSLGDWLKKVAKKAAELIKKVWKKVVGLFPGPPKEAMSIRVSILGVKEKRYGEPDMVEVPLKERTLKWREEDHPRNPDGTFKDKP